MATDTACEVMARLGLPLRVLYMITESRAPSFELGCIYVTQRLDSTSSKMQYSHKLGSCLYGDRYRDAAVLAQQFSTQVGFDRIFNICTDCDRRTRYAHGSRTITYCRHQKHSHNRCSKVRNIGRRAWYPQGCNIEVNMTFQHGVSQATFII